MVRYFMHCSGRPYNNFYLDWDQSFFDTLQGLAERNEPTIMIGVSFAILDLFEKNNVRVWDDLLVIETGGMKGRRQEITREELRARIFQHAPGLTLSSEYGMTELLSQAYLREDRFCPGPTMRVFIRDISDPFSLVPEQQRGAINIIDVANLDSCAFIATDDIGIRYPDGSFDVLGRLDQSEVRGCNLMYA
jgi:hypothetical protein